MRAQPQSGHSTTHPDRSHSNPRKVEESISDELIVFYWQGAGEKQNRVEMRFEATGDRETLVQISEEGWETNERELKLSYGNCMGWSQMLSALKAYAEYGIDLRKGAYTGMYTAEDMK